MAMQRLGQLYLTILLHFQFVFLFVVVKLGLIAGAGVTRKLCPEDKKRGILASPREWFRGTFGPSPAPLAAPAAPQAPSAAPQAPSAASKATAPLPTTPPSVADNTPICEASARSRDEQNRSVCATVKSLFTKTMPPVSTTDSMREDKKERMSSKQRPAVSRVGGSSGQFSPLLVALAGLPARGKTHVAHRLARHLNWQGESTKVFECSEYRRRRMEAYMRHEMFRADHPTGAAVREQSAHEAVQDAITWLKEGNSIAIFDGTNITAQQRTELQNYCAKDLGFRVLFVECICDDEELMKKNIFEILHYSADYKNMTENEALEDLQNKLEHYMTQYEPIDPLNEDISYIRVLNGGESVTAHKLGGQRESAILGYLANVKPMPQTIYFTRHGESEYNVLGRIGGDANLSPRGYQYARALAEYMNSQPEARSLEVWTSEMKRTKQTAEHIRAPKFCVRPLNELDAGICEGLTYEEMQQRFPQEFAWRDQDKLRYRYPWGESYIDIMSRLRPALGALSNSTNVLLVGHQAILRCVLGYFMDAKLDELPYMNVPLHTIVKLTAHGHKYHVELHRLPVDCVDTHRHQPKNCSTTRTSDDALVTVPSHYDTLPSSLWQSTNSTAL